MVLPSILICLFFAALTVAITEIRQIANVHNLPLAKPPSPSPSDNIYKCALKECSFNRLALEPLNSSHIPIHSFKVSEINSSFTVKISHSSLLPASFNIDIGKIDDQTAIITVSVEKTGVLVPRLEHSQWHQSIPILYNIGTAFVL